MEILSKDDALLLSYLRQNSRETLTRLSKKTDIPISTLYGKLKRIQGNFIRKNTCLVNFDKLGYLKVNFMLTTEANKREELKQHLSKHLHINSLYRINNGFDFLVEGIFRSILEAENFLDKLEQKFPIRKKQIHFVIEEVRKEEFLADENLLELL
jgi:DNA-binding Lrp family transcriptional regulator